MHFIAAFTKIISGCYRNLGKEGNLQESKDWSFFFWGVELVDFGHFLLGGGGRSTWDFLGRGVG